MQVKKAGGRVYGAKLTAAERKAMDLEIQRQLAEYDKNHEVEMAATVLWVLHDTFGWGEMRLRRFLEAYHERLCALVDHYEMYDDGDDVWLCTHKLMAKGIDVARWVRELQDK